VVLVDDLVAQDTLRAVDRHVGRSGTGGRGRWVAWRDHGDSDAAVR